MNPVGEKQFNSLAYFPFILNISIFGEQSHAIAKI